MLEFSFLFLAAFGATLLPRVKNFRRASILVPVILATIWGIGIVVLRSFFTIDTGLWDVADVWTRYAVAVPAGLLACIGLIGQWRVFRKAGMERFGRDALLAAFAFALVWPAGPDHRAREPAAALNGDQSGSLLAHVRLSHSTAARRCGRGVGVGDYSFPAII